MSASTAPSRPISAHLGGEPAGALGAEGEFGGGGTIQEYASRRGGAHSEGFPTAEGRRGQGDGGVRPIDVAAHT